MIDASLNGGSNYTSQKADVSVPIVKAGYLLRTVEVSGRTLALTGDLNATTPIEVIGGAPDRLSRLTWNGNNLRFKQSRTGVVTATAAYTKPEITVPDLSTVGWKVIDSLPEIKSSYDDSAWTEATLSYTNNTIRNLTTPTSLYSSDYGYHTGNLIYRGHFTATGAESTIYLQTQGGSAFGMTAWLNGTYLGSWRGADRYSNGNNTFTLPNLKSGSNYVLTVLIDNMGLDENWVVGAEQMKNPRGVLDYNLSGRSKSAISWKLTGNLGGENYQDHTRGPLNEGGLYAERQGYHLPGAPISSWASSDGPTEGISAPGVAFYAATFDLNLPAGYDVPLSLRFANTTGTEVNGTVAAYRAQIYVNGYQFGKYVHNVGPQDTFPVPEGIWNYHGENYLAVSLWALDPTGAKLSDFSLVTGTPVQSGYGPIGLSPMTGWTKRQGAY